MEENKKRTKVKAVRLIWNDERIEAAIKLYEENKIKAKKLRMIA